MADDRRYVPGDYYRICDRTGFKVRDKRTRKEWEGYQIRDESWEPRQPQDFVQGWPDDQTVPKPRPRQPDVFVFPQAGALFLVQDASDAPSSSASTPTPGIRRSIMVSSARFFVYRGNVVSAANYPRSG